jgi:protein TonB
MFDLVKGDVKHLPRNQGVPIVISTTIQVLVAVLIFAIPYLYVTEQLPELPSMMAFVAAPPPPPPPPPPPAPAQPVKKTEPVAPKPDRFTAPIEAPPTVMPEPVATAGADEGVPGGVEGGVPGGVLGGIVGGIPEPTPPPPPPPPPAQRAPVRTGGNIKTPALVHRVEPEYPALAQAAQIEGVVILEAIVDEEGHVDEVKVLRSAGAGGVMDRAAITAVKQWRYSPLLLNGKRERFVLTVVLSFTLADR